ncbi:glycosyltransferase [Flavobacterium sp.]|uniref:glycosyltransferase n=1 Tax=Flavobacterium sp. TaxID=239 RepID=UPI003BDB004B
MKIILFVHPTFLISQSMPRYANLLINELEKRGHEIEVWQPKARFYNLLNVPTLKKWLGYIDQFIVFPLEVKLKLKKYPSETLFVFADQALGPWVPLIKNRPHVIHCHDFLALKSALGKVPENPTSFSGKIYQNFIRKGFSKGKYFISISHKTKVDLHEFHFGEILSSDVCYNGLNREFKKIESFKARKEIENRLKINLSSGYILHLGGNQYYKNRKGVIEIYEAFRKRNNDGIPLLLIGPKPTDKLNNLYNKSKYKEDIHFITDLQDEYINTAYSGATCLLFPSLDEGFGWPIAEAMASGCLVVTTDEAPMNEVVGKANNFLISRMPFNEKLVSDWAYRASEKLVEIKGLSDNEKEIYLNTGFESVKRFNTIVAINNIEKVYKSILKK